MSACDKTKNSSKNFARFLLTSNAWDVTAPHLLRLWHSRTIYQGSPNCGPPPCDTYKL